MKLFRGRLVTGTPNGTIINTESDSLVIDFVHAPGEALVLSVTAASGENHAYAFTAPAELHPGSANVTLLTKIIVKPGETLAQVTPGSAEVTGHFE